MVINYPSGPYRHIRHLLNQAQASATRFQADVDNWCYQSLTRLENEHIDQNYSVNGTAVVWVIKYTKPKYLKNFFGNNNARLLNVSLGSNYTWGDALYVAPLYAAPHGNQDYRAALTSAMFGRAGIVGYIPIRDNQYTPLLKVFDASKDKPDGIKLYHEWIKRQSVLYDHLTTSMHAQQAKYYLAKFFRWTFDIDLVLFNPDEYNKRYVDVIHDHWFAISTWEAINKTLQPPGIVPIAIPTDKTPYTDKVKECRWVVRVEEEFERDDSNYQYNIAFGEHIEQVSTVPPSQFRANRSTMYKAIMDAYQAQSNPNSPHIDDTKQLVLKVTNTTPNLI